MPSFSTSINGRDLRSTIIKALDHDHHDDAVRDRIPQDPATVADDIMVDLLFDSAYNEHGDYVPGYRDWAMGVGLITGPTYTIVVMTAAGRNLRRDLEDAPSIDVSDLDQVPESALTTCLCQIIDQGHEWGGANEAKAEGLYALAQAFVQSGSEHLSFKVPDGWTITIRRNQS